MTPRVDQADFRVHRFPPKYLRQSKYVFEVSPTIVPHILRSKRPECTRMRLRVNDSAARRDKEKNEETHRQERAPFALRRITLLHPLCTHHITTEVLVFGRP